MSSGFGDWDKAKFKGSEKRRVCGIHRRMEWAQERLPQVFCCRAQHESGGLDLEEHTEKRIPIGSLPAFLAGAHRVIFNRNLH